MKRMPRPQFSIRTLLWLTLVVAAFLGGMLLGRTQERALIEANMDAYIHLADQNAQAAPDWHEQMGSEHPDDNQDSWD